MSPTNAPVSTQLRQLIYYYLDNDLAQNALFFAGRLHALEPRSADAAHLLALCQFRLGHIKAAYDVARDKGFRGQHLGCAYVFAQACLALDRCPDGIGALDRARGLWGGRSHWNKHSETSRRHIPDGAAVNCLLGKLWKTHGDMKKAVDCYVEALKLNPFMWDAFLDLCDTGAAIRPSNVFKMSPEMQAIFSQQSMPAPTIVSNVGFEPHQTPTHPVPVKQGQMPIVTPVNDPFNSIQRNSVDLGLNLGGSNLLSKLNGSTTTLNGGATAHYPDFETPTTNGTHYDEDIMMGDVSGHPHQMEPPHAPMRKMRTAQTFTAETNTDAPKMRSITTRSRFKTDSSSNESTAATEQQQPLSRIAAPSNHKRTISGHATQSSGSAPAADPTAAPQRRSVRLFNQISQIRPSSSKLAAATGRDTESKEKRELRKAKATGTKGRSTTTSTVGRVVSGNRKPVTEMTDHNLKDARPPSVASGQVTTIPKPNPVVPPDTTREQQEAIQWLLDLLCKLGTGYYHLSRFQCQSAVVAFLSVPAPQRDTPWVLAQIGKAHHERQAYADAEETFLRMKKLEPSRTQDMEVYSTVLWHLRKETDLAYLSHELIEADRLSPQAWCAIGNSFSLQREHDQAIKCFKRATQLDPKFAYAWTLQGHEHVANEEFDKALFAYRCAVAADHRHYNGWYGLGEVYEKMGKFDVSEKHYKSAAKINPSNAVIIARIGVVLEKSKKTHLALTHYSHACELDPKAQFARFKKAHALMKLRRTREAFKELEVLKNIAPDNANVHFMLGRLYKALGDRTSAVRCMTVALSLDPKAAPVIKEAMEGLEDEDDDDFESQDVV